MQKNLGARPVPTLKILFDRNANEVKQFVAPKIDPLKNTYIEADIHPIEKAYKSQNGNALFRIGFSDWYIIDTKEKTAYKLKNNSSSDELSILLNGFKNEITKEEIKIEDLPQEITSLKEFSDEEKDNLFKALTNKEITVIGQPIIQEITQAFQNPKTEEYFIIVHNKNGQSEDSNTKLYTGWELDELQEIALNNVETQRATFCYNTDIGTLTTNIYDEKPTTLKTQNPFSEKILEKIDINKIMQKIGNNDPRFSGPIPWDNQSHHNLP